MYGFLKDRYIDFLRYSNKTKWRDLVADMSNRSCYDLVGNESQQARSNLSAEASPVNDISMTITENLDKLNLAASVCLLHGCMVEKNNYMLRCNACKLEIRYECTRLPPYQIHQFNQRGYRKYICENCTISIPEDVKEHCNNATTTKFKNSEEENRTLKMKIEDLQKRN